MLWRRTSDDRDVVKIWPVDVWPEITNLEPADLLY